MSEFDSKKLTLDDDPIIFDLDDIVSSSEPLKLREKLETEALELAAEKTEEQSGESSPVERELALPKLPELEKENRARLQMQTPNRLFFYWSVRNNPFQILHRAFGQHTESYSLVAKLIDLTRDTEEIFSVDAEGSWWFNVDSNSKYRAEIGFYAPNRPYVRVMFSNTIETPRKKPSPRAATADDWNITADTFAQVLDVSGFRQDAVDVALAGDDQDASHADTNAAFARFVDRDESDFAGIASDELRYALLLIASGLTIEHLRYRIDASVFAILQAHEAKLNTESALAALRDQFGVDDEELFEEEAGSAVFGASLVNFPRVSKRKRTMPKYEPLSSLSLPRA